MNQLTSAMTYLWSVMAIICQIAILILIITFLTKKYLKISALIFDRCWSFLNANALRVSFLVALGASLGSIYYSEIAGFIPCNLCWYQRIFMYPQAIILGLAWYYRERTALKYSLTLSLIGALISLYNYYLQLVPNAASFCASSESCATSPFFYFGYITISTLALTAFSVLILSAWAGQSIGSKKLPAKVEGERTITMPPAN